MVNSYHPVLLFKFQDLVMPDLLQSIFFFLVRIVFRGDNTENPAQDPYLPAGLKGAFLI